MSPFLSYFLGITIRWKTFSTAYVFITWEIHCSHFWIPTREQPTSEALVGTMLFHRYSCKRLMRQRKETAVSHRPDSHSLQSCLSHSQGKCPGSTEQGFVVSKVCCCHQYKQSNSASSAVESNTFYEAYLYKNTFRVCLLVGKKKKKGIDFISGKWQKHQRTILKQHFLNV